MSSAVAAEADSKRSTTINREEKMSQAEMSPIEYFVDEHTEQVVQWFEGGWGKSVQQLGPTNLLVVVAAAEGWARKCIKEYNAEYMDGKTFDIVSPVSRDFVIALKAALHEVFDTKFPGFHKEHGEVFRPTMEQTMIAFIVPEIKETVASLIKEHHPEVKTTH